MTRYSGNWHKPVHRTIHELREKYGLKWLRVRMVYKRHANLKEMLLSDAHQKVMEGIFDKITAPQKCNCWNSHKTNGACIYKWKCKTTMVIHKIKCKYCGKFYISKTQNSTKSYISTHINDMSKLWRVTKLFNHRIGIDAASLLSNSQESLSTIAEESSSSRTAPRSGRLTEQNHQTSIATPKYQQ